MDCDVQTYKVRSVIKCYKQRQIGWLWWNLLAVTMLKSIKILLTIIVYYDDEFDKWMLKLYS